MGVFHVFKIVQMLPNLATRHICLLQEGLITPEVQRRITAQQVLEDVFRDQLL